MREFEKGKMFPGDSIVVSEGKVKILSEAEAEIDMSESGSDLSYFEPGEEFFIIELVDLSQNLEKAQKNKAKILEVDEGRKILKVKFLD